MPEQLKIVIDADVSGANTGLKALQGGIVKLNKTTLDFVSTLKGSFDPAVFKSFVGGTANINQMKLALETLKENMRHVSDPKTLVQYNLAIKDIEGNLKKASVAGTQFGGEAGKAFSSLTQSAFSLARILPGIGIAGIISIAADALINLAQEFFKSSEAAAKNSDIIGGAGKEYEKAVVNVNELRNEISLAKDGFISKDAVVKHYNETIGKTTGQVKSLDEAEQALNRNADAYIKFTLLKAAANVALGKAAEQSFNQALQAQKDFEQNSKDFGKKPATGKVTLGATDAGAGDLNALQKRQLDAQKKTKEIFDKRIKGFEAIAKDFNTQAALISSSFKFDFFGDIDPKKQTKSFDDIIARAKAFIKEFGNVFVVPDLEVSFTNTKENVQKAAVKLLDDIDKGLLKLKLLERPREINIPVEIDFTVSNDLKKQRDELFKNATISGDNTKIIKGIVPGASEDVAKRNKAFFDDFQKQILATADLVTGVLAPAFTGMFDAIVAGENPLKAFFKNLMQSVNQLIKRLIAAAIQAAVLSALSGGGTSFFGAFSKILGGAFGGSANRFSLGGDIGSRSFNNVIQITGGTRIAGNDIVIAYNRTNNSNRISG